MILSGWYFKMNEFSVAQVAFDALTDLYAGDVQHSVARLAALGRPEDSDLKTRIEAFARAEIPVPQPRLRLVR
jgi:hypothetical protein